MSHETAPARPAQATLFGDPGEATVEVEGTVRRTRVTREETGFRVMDVALDTGKVDTWVGVMPNMPNGTHARAVGVYESSKFGLQLKVHTVVAVMPSDPEALIEYLSDLVPGVGPVLARRIVTHFGTETQKVLEESVERVAEVPGIGAKKAQAMHDKWLEVRVVGQILVWLQSNGASPALAMKVFKRFGSRAIELVSANPYRLALDVPGVGFLTADKIAKRLGVGHASVERAQAGTLHCLEQATAEGHCYVPVRTLIAAARKLLDVEASTVTVALTALGESGHVKVEGTGQARRIFPAKLLDAEERVASRLHALLAAPLTAGPWPRLGASPARPTAGAVDVNAVIRAYEKSTGIQLAPEQADAVRAAATSKVLVITGGPGTGKTTITKCVLALFDALKLDVKLASPTGRAAKRLAEVALQPAQTIHRLLEYDPKEHAFKRHRGNPIEATALVVDETSMLDLKLADDLLAAVHDGTRLVLVGDVDQLPSVEAGAVLRDLIASGVIPTVRLARIFRQAEGSGIIDNAHRINRGEAPVGATTSDGDFFVFERLNASAAADMAVHLATERIPRAFGIRPRDVRVLSPMKKGDAGTVTLNQRLQATINPTGPSVVRGGVEFRVGDLVMQTANSYDRGVFNGDVGTILRIEPSLVKEGKKTVVVEIDEAEVPYEERDLRELQLAYASTIHKAQGGQFKAVVLVMLSTHFVMLSRNLFYTAVTRGEKKVAVITDQRAVAAAISETRRGQRHTTLAARLRGAMDDEVPDPDPFNELGPDEPFAAAFLQDVGDR